MATGKRKVVNKILLFALIGLVPGLFLYVFSRGKQVFTTPGYYGALISPEGDTSYHVIPNFTFKTSDNTSGQLSDYNGKIIVAMVLGTSCPEDCEIHVEGFTQILLKELRKSSYEDVVVMVELVNYDQTNAPSFEDIAPFKEEFKLPDNCIFIQANPNKLFDWKVLPNTPNLLKKSIPGARNGKAYYNFALLIDKKRNIRGIHNIGSSSEHIRDLLDDIKILKKAEDYEN